jgi:hypothetical protein
MLHMAKPRTYHVMTRIGGGWSVQREGSGRATGTYDSKDQAVKRAREAARSAGGDVVIHSRDGLIQHSMTYPTREGSVKTKRRQVALSA